VTGLQFILCLGIVFLASLVRSTFGFGDALLAMPLLALLVDIKIATPLMGLVAVCLATSMLIREWRNVDFSSTLKLTLPSFAGIPLGLFLLKSSPQFIIKGVLGVILILFGAYNLFMPRLPVIKNSIFTYLAGFIAGILGGAYNTNGPPVIIYGVLSQWDRDRFRATLQAYFAPAAIMISISQGVAGLWTSNVFRLAIFAAPLVFLAVFLGRKFSKKIKPGSFDRVIYSLLVVMGILMFI
jgi:uncharacterized protein